MKFFSRMMMVVALLGFLAYGSFAFGKYVLSAKLFGDEANSSSTRNMSRSTTQASAITRQTGWKGTKPRVDVKVLPSEDSSIVDVPAFADEDGFNKERNNDDEESTPRTRRAPKVEDPAPAAKLGNRQFDDASVQYTLGSEKEDEDRPRRRRRRSRSRSSEKRDSETRKTSEQNDGDSAEVTARSDSGSSGSDSAESSSSSSRERSSNENDRPRESTRTRRQGSDSPVPRPEGSSSSGGGDSANISPVPQPE